MPSIAAVHTVKEVMEGVPAKQAVKQAVKRAQPAPPALKSVPTGRFWKLFNALDATMQKDASDHFKQWQEGDTSLDMKPLNGISAKVGDVWRIRLGRGFRAIAYKQSATHYIWDFIGSHPEAEKEVDRIKRSK